MHMGGDFLLDLTPGISVAVVVVEVSIQRSEIACRKARRLLALRKTTALDVEAPQVGRSVTLTFSKGSHWDKLLKMRAENGSQVRNYAKQGPSGQFAERACR